MYKQDLKLNNLEGFICHRSQPTNYIYIYIYIEREREGERKREIDRERERERSACSVMVIVIENGHGESCSNPGRSSLHFTQR